jgi:hypothetical protein
MTANFGYGQLSPYDTTDDLSRMVFIIRQIIARMETTKLVQVKAVHGGGAAPAGTVDVIPLVNMLDGNGNSFKHGTVFGLPWSRVQGGQNAIICDPQVNDIGYVVAADRDISNVKSTLARANPGSLRRFDIADGIYAGSCLSVAPNQYLIFTSTGVRLVDLNGNSITMSTSGISWTDVSGNQMITGPGFVNFVTGALQINGVPVTVP